jgi:hypothetical protein
MSEASAGGSFGPPAASLALPPVDQETRDELKAEQRSVPKPFDLEKPSQDELTELAPVRRLDMVNQAVGSDFLGLDWTDAAWTFHDGWPFAVTRYYPHQKIAVDFPRRWRDVEWVNEKRTKLEAQGIVFVAIMPNEALTVHQLRARIAQARKGMTG